MSPLDTPRPIRRLHRELLPLLLLPAAAVYTRLAVIDVCVRLRAPRSVWRALILAIQTIYPSNTEVIINQYLAKYVSTYILC